MRNAGLDEAQAGIKIAGRNINHLRYADDTTLVAKSEELKSLLQHHSSKASNSLAFSFLYSPTLTSIHDHWKNHSLD